MDGTKKRNPLLPWFIGIAIVLVADFWIAYRMYATDCPAPGFIETLIIVVLPAVYLGLMYLTFKSQA
jgi:hypothetical protein